MAGVFPETSAFSLKPSGSQMTDTKIVKLENLVRPTPLIIEVDGVKHPLVAATVETYIANMRDIQALAINADPVAELELGVKLIHRAFPTLSEKQIRGWTVDVIHQLAQIARGASGEVATTDEAELPSAEGNAQPA